MTNCKILIFGETVINPRSILKKNYIVFKSRQTKLNYNFLGAYLDEHLTWKLHISFACKQIAKSESIKFRSRVYLLSLQIFYYVLIYPFITYRNTTWSSAYVSNLNRNFYFQKRAVRDITYSDYRLYSAHLGVLVIFQINTFQMTKFMFNYRYQLWCPMFLN